MAAEKQVTTYRVLRLTKFDGVDNEGWTEVGAWEVPSGQSDRAERLALAQLARAYPEDTSHRLVSVPVRSWSPTVYELEPPAAPRFKPVTS